MEELQKDPEDMCQKLIGKLNCEAGKVLEEGEAEVPAVGGDEGQAGDDKEKVTEDETEIEGTIIPAEDKILNGWLGTTYSFG